MTNISATKVNSLLSNAIFFVDDARKVNVSNISSTSSNIYYSESEVYFTLVLLACMSAITVIGNSLVIAAFLTNKKLRTTTNYYIVSLCVADIIVGMIVDNFYAVYVRWNRWPLSKSICIVWLTLDYWVYQASVFGVLIITIDRFLLIKYPFIKHTRTRTSSRVKVVIVCKWLVSFLIWAPPIFYYEKEIGEIVKLELDCGLPFQKEMWVILLTGLFSYVMPVVIMIYIAAHTYHLLISNRRLLKQTTFRVKSRKVTLDTIVMFDNSQISISSFENEDSVGLADEFKRKNSDWLRKASVAQRVSKASLSMLRITSRKRSSVASSYTRQSQRVVEISKISTFVLLMAIAFTVTTLPFGILSIIKAFSKESVSSRAWRVACTLAYFNSVLNPLCYAFGKKNFNVALRKMLCRKRFCKSSKSTRKSNIFTRN